MTSESDWRVKLSHQANRDLRKLPRNSFPKVYSALHRLKHDPDAGSPLTGSLSGIRALHFSLPGSGQFRAVYSVEADRRVCFVFLIGSRENFYREAERRRKSLRDEEGSDLGTN